MAIFPIFFLGNIGHENVFYDILEEKNAFIAYKKNKFKKSKNWHFSKEVNPWFWFKICDFSTFFFKQYRPGKCLLRYSRKKKRLCRLLKQVVQNVEKLTFFPWGLTQCFCPKMAIFATFFFWQCRPGKCLLRYSRTKNAFLGYKNNKFKKSKNWHFSKEVNPWFWSKNGHFSNFFFRQYRPGKCLLRYSRTKKRLSRL